MRAEPKPLVVVVEDDHAEQDEEFIVSRFWVSLGESGKIEGTMDGGHIKSFGDEDEATEHAEKHD